jgi:hypothetical protein
MPVRPPSPRLLLLCLLAGLLLFSPFWARFEALHAVFDGVLFLAILAALRESQTTRLHIILCGAVGAVWLGLSVVFFVIHPELPLTIAYAASSALFYFLSVFYILRGILLEREVSLDAIAGAVAVYLLLAMLFGTMFTSLELVAPGSFVKVFPPGELHAAAWQDLMYLSFTALTPLKGGYVEAVSPWGNVLLTLEAFLGVFYLAVLVSRLVRLYQDRDRAR